MQYRSVEYREVTLDLHLVEYSATILMTTTYVLDVADNTVYLQTQQSLDNDWQNWLQQ